MKVEEDAAASVGVWRDASVPLEERVDALIAEMDIEQKLAQLVGLWVRAGAGDGEVAPSQEEMTRDLPEFANAIVNGLGQLTRPFGTAPIDPKVGAASLARSQQAIMKASRLGIPAQVHEECLAGLAAWRATAYPVPLSWGASFDRELVETMARQIGDSMRALGVHQGLAPVLDVVRDYRWGRVEETIGEDPMLVGQIGASYVRGLESAGIVATLKHFAGYSGSRGGRNHAPVSAGPREMADIYYPPFEMALREGGARSVMNSYAAVDGVPAAADEALLTGLLRDEWGFEGTVVADYFAIAFLHTNHRVAVSDEEAAALALSAGIDVELPSLQAYAEPLRRAVTAGAVPMELVDRALRRVLRQKIELGLLDADYHPEAAGPFEVDTPAQRNVAHRLAREAVVLAKNDGVLPLAPEQRIALIGPLAEEPSAMLGCYSFPQHVGVHHPSVPRGIDIPTVAEALRAVHPAEILAAKGCEVSAPGREGFAAAVLAAEAADVAVVVLGDRAGLFGRGTSGEGCDASDLSLPGEQGALLDAVLSTGTPVVLLVISGRPYALGDYADRVAAVVQCFFPGQEGGVAIAEILTGAVNPSGHLPVGIPAHSAGQPSTYLTSPLGRTNGASNIETDALYPFGHGLAYSNLTWGDVRQSATTWATDGTVEVEVDLANESGREVSDVVQVYLHGPSAPVTRPVSRLVAFERVTLAPGASATMKFSLHADLTSAMGLRERVVAPGSASLSVARSSEDVHATCAMLLDGPQRAVGPDRVLSADVMTMIREA